MIFLLRGNNSYRALKKISEIRSAFHKKGGDSVAVVEIDGADASYENILERISAGNLFAKKRLVICKHIIENHPQFADIMDTEKLSASPDVFLFWERYLSDDSKVYMMFKNIATKIEDTMARTPSDLDRWLQKEASSRGIALSSSERAALLETVRTQGDEAIEWGLEAELEKLMLSRKVGVRKFELSIAGRTMPSLVTNDKRVFMFADKVYYNNFSHAPVVRRRSQDEGVYDAELLRIILWKLKNIFLVRRGETSSINAYVAQKAKSEAARLGEKDILDAFWSGVLTDSSLKWDGKNSEEHFDRYLLMLKNK